YRGFTRRVVRSRVLAPCSAHAVALMLLTGCAAVGPNYKRPEVTAPTTWKEAAAATNALVMPTNWWTIFADAELDRLQTQAIAANQDLKIAVARVTEARALTRISKADLYPSLSSSGGYSRNRQSENRA